MKVCEIFASIQGESSYAGLPCVFVRITGCNLRCPYCDTTYAFEQGTEISEEEIIGKVDAYGLKVVELTGGEPLLQREVPHLITSLLDRGYTVLVETNGSIGIGKIDKRAVIIMDIKTPESGFFQDMDLSNLDHLKPTDELKFVLTGREDYDWAKEFIREHELTERCTVLFSPIHGPLPPEELSKWIVEDRLPVRLNLQIHKYIRIA
ncbi:MAG: radical SAM protein [Nitrospirales bacterium]|nr:radical SAM protein [Nitrospirales bacterium]